MTPTEDTMVEDTATDVEPPVAGGRIVPDRSAFLAISEDATPRTSDGGMTQGGQAIRKLIGGLRWRRKGAPVAVEERAHSDGAAAARHHVTHGVPVGELTPLPMASVLVQARVDAPSEDAVARVPSVRPARRRAILLAAMGAILLAEGAFVVYEWSGPVTVTPVAVAPRPAALPVAIEAPRPNGREQEPIVEVRPTPAPARTAMRAHRAPTLVKRTMTPPLSLPSSASPPPSSKLDREL